MHARTDWRGVREGCPRVARIRLLFHDFRLLLLVAAVSGSGLFIYNWIYVGLPQTRGDNKVLIACLEKARIAQPTDGLARNTEFERCRAPIEQSKGRFMLAGIGVLLAGAVGIYLLLPPLKLRRGRLEALSEEDAPEVLTALRELCREAGLESTPDFVWNPLNPAAYGLAFGRLGRHYVALSGGMVSRFHSDPDGFRSVALHELAHLRSADVDKTYFAVALWWAFIALGVVPLATTLFRQPSVAEAGSLGWLMGWRLIVLTVIVYLIRNAVLRSREAYADLRASTWDGPRSALPRVLAELRGRAGGRLSLIAKSFSTHPDPDARRALLGDTRSLFRIGVWEAFGTGLAAAVAFPNLVALQLMFLTGLTPNFFYLTTGQIASLAAAVVIGSLAAAVVGLGVWRAAFIELLGRTRSLQLGRLALALTAGLALGQWLSLTSGFEPTGQPSNPFILASAYLAWAAVLLLGLWLLLRWARSVGLAWLGVALARGLGRPSYVPALVTLAVLLSVWLGLLLYIREIGSGAALIGDTGVLPAFELGAGIAMQFAINPVSVLLLASLWAIPFASRLQASRRTAPGWVYLDLAGSQTESRTGVAAPLALQPAVLMALGSSALFFVMDLFIHAYLHQAVSEVQRSQLDYKIQLLAAQILLAALIQGYVGAGAAAQSGPLPVIRGLFAAFIAGALMTIALLAVNLVVGGTISVTLVLLTLGGIVNLGAALALPLGAMMLALRRSQGEATWLKPSIQT